MPILKMLHLNTGHLTLKDVKQLMSYQADHCPPSKALTAYPYEFGWTVSTVGLNGSEVERFEKIDAMRREGFSEYFVNVMLYGSKADACMVRFDRDAPFEPELPKIDWNNDLEITLDTWRAPAAV